MDRAGATLPVGELNVIGPHSLLNRNRRAWRRGFTL